MAWEEWEQLKASAAERQPTRMQLNQMPADPGGSAPSGRENGGGGRLKHSAQPWNRAAKTADDLRSSTNTTRTALTTAHEGMVRGLTGLESLAELKGVLTSWEKRLDAVRDECESLEPTLRAVGKELAGVDTGTAARVNAVRVNREGDAE
ncbi:amino acid ABC transporter permease [Streptomyces sp. DH24]|uniref:amino acid ABC transporter permease n=1 Tax=Streptomyces sp. DH24 TaxID=3040123 RepID=UPI002441788C|nr:amino acid ABC transporter permease [Streptomyces sp. DH24]MDG9716971.1 amino acid ABC transporter permease [Streptomyces sp. DH24]